MNKKIAYSLIGLLVLVAMAFAGYKLFAKKKSSTSEEQSILDSLKSAGVVLNKGQILPTDTTVTENDAAGFVPAEITVKRHSRVVWINDTSTYIWPASNPHPTHTDYPEFDAKLPLEMGKAWGFVFDRVGDWGYHDHLRPNQRGVVHVTQ